MRSCVFLFFFFALIASVEALDPISDIFTFTCGALCDDIMNYLAMCGLNSRLFENGVEVSILGIANAVKDYFHGSLSLDDLIFMHMEAGIEYEEMNPSTLIKYINTTSHCADREEGEVASIAWLNEQRTEASKQQQQQHSADTCIGATDELADPVWIDQQRCAALWGFHSQWQLQADELEKDAKGKQQREIEASDGTKASDDVDDMQLYYAQAVVEVLTEDGSNDEADIMQRAYVETLSDVLSPGAKADEVKVAKLKGGAAEEAEKPEEVAT